MYIAVGSEDVQRYACKASEKTQYSSAQYPNVQTESECDALCKEGCLGFMMIPNGDDTAVKGDYVKNATCALIIPAQLFYKKKTMHNAADKECDITHIVEP